MKRNVLIIGSGNVGVAVGMGLSSVGHSIIYLDKNPRVLKKLQEVG